MVGELIKSWMCTECGTEFNAKPKRTLILGFPKLSCPGCKITFTAPYTMVGRWSSRILFVIFALTLIPIVMLPFVQEITFVEYVEHVSNNSWLTFLLVLALLLGVARAKDTVLVKKLEEMKKKKASINNVTTMRGLSTQSGNINVHFHKVYPDGSVSVETKDGKMHTFKSLSDARKHFKDLAERGQSGEEEILMNNQSKDKPKPSTNYTSKVGNFFGILGIVLAGAYAMSPLNPNKGKLLSLEQNLIIFGAAFAFYLIGSGIGFIFDRWIERRESNRG